MAVGARITSENLSGKTATVTFTPYTGTTSGTTVNLGIKTIPFNNITSHPYGDYSIYLAEYDYTYTLNIPEPVTDSHLYVFVSKMVNDNNYGAATLNFNDFTATVIDMNVDTNIWNINDLYPLTNSGFGYHFNDNDCGQLVIFTDASNVEVGRYSGDTCNYDFNNFDGRWIYFEDQSNGIIKYFDGTTIFTYDYDQTRYSIDVQWDEDAVMSNNSFILIKVDEGQGIDHHAVLFKSDGTQTTLKSWTNNDAVWYNFQLQAFSDFYVVAKMNPGGYESIEMCNLDGTTLETITLSGTTYNDNYFDFYGTNKYITTIWNQNDSNIDYKIIQYNLNNTTLIQTSHVRGDNYTFLSMANNTFYWPGGNLSENLALTFSNNTWNNYTWAGYEINYADIMYIFGNQTSFTTYVVANNQTVHMEPYFDQTGTDMFRTRFDAGDNIASVLTIISGGTHIESLNVNISGITGNNSYSMDNRTVYGFYTDNEYTGYTMSLINLTGGTQDTKTIEFIEANGSNQSRNTHSTFYFGCNSITLDGYGGWYLNDNTTGFTQTEYYTILEDSWDFYKPDFLENSDIVLYDFVNQKSRVLTATGISNQFDLTTSNTDRGIRVGNNMFIHYYNTEDGYYHIKLYDFNGTLLNTLDTTFNNYDGIYAADDRFVARFYNSNTSTYVMYMISANSIQSVSLDNFNTYDTANDYIWWD